MKKSIKIGVIGAGRLGRLHIKNLAKSVNGAEVIGIADIAANEELIQWAADLGIKDVYTNPHELINRSDLEAVVVCSSTDTHIDLMIAAAEAGKDIFLEKPIGLETEKVLEGIKAVEKTGVKIQVGYVRRFDRNYKKVRDTVASGKLGKPHIVKITSRDACPPPFEYAKVSGGLFLDMSIHDFDIARYLSGSEVEEVSAFGAVMMNPQLEEIGDIDAATIMLRMKNGVLCIIDNIRKSGYGYDVRSEVECENGCVQSNNDTQTSTIISTMDGIVSDLPKWFFPERFEEAFRDEMISFIDDLRNDRTPQIGLNDGLASMLIAKAAKKSADEGRIVKMNEFEEIISHTAI